MSSSRHLALLFRGRIKMDVLINLTLNGLATGMLIFLLAAGLTLIFGLMDVLNFAHGGLFAWGAYSGIWI